MPQPEHGIPVVLGKVDQSMVGKKLRLVGRMLWYEPASGLVALVDDNRAVLVDVSLCVTSESQWAREPRCQLLVLGHLESYENYAFPSYLDFIWKDVLPMPSAPEQGQAPVMNAHIVLRAVLVTRDDSLNIAEYNAFLEEEEM